MTEYDSHDSALSFQFLVTPTLGNKHQQIVMAYAPRRPELMTDEIAALEQPIHVPLRELQHVAYL